MDAPAPTVNDFVVRLLTLTRGSLDAAVDGLGDEQLWARPAPDANSIAWLAWHYSRWMDGMTAKASGEEETWTAGGWHDRFGLTADANGYGDTPEQVGAFRPSRALLLGYADAAHEAGVRRVQALTPGDLLRPFRYQAWSAERPVWQSLANTAMDFTQHVGQIAYLRGLLTGYGWWKSRLTPPTPNP